MLKRIINGVKKKIIKGKVALDARAVLSALNEKRGLFLDVGSNVGQGFQYFRRFYDLDYFDYILIEPNPKCLEILRKRFSKEISRGMVEVIPKAAGIRAGKARLYGLVEGEGDATSQGASTLKEHNSIYYEADVDNSAEVETFSLSDLIHLKAGNYSTVIVKIDIEGSEYEVLENLISTKAMSKLDIIYVEFHSQYMKDEDRRSYQKREPALIKEAKEMGAKFRLWI